MDLVHILFNPNGRIGRKSFWIGWAISLVAGIVLGMIPVIGMLIGLANIYVGVCVYGKRLHDMGKTAWLYGGLLIAMMGIGIIGGVMAGVGAAAAGGDAAGMMAMGGMGLLFLILGVIGLAFTVWVGVSPGEEGANKYGPIPADRAGLTEEPPAV